MSRKIVFLNNWISYLGFLLGIIFLAGEAILIVMDFIEPSHNPYTGILVYIVGPSILVTGLILVPIGMWLDRWRRQKGGLAPDTMPVLDLNRPEDRHSLEVFVIVTMFFVALSAVGTYKAYHVTESVEFCGTLCHQVMIPEYVAYQHSPHARVSCVECHIGPGADWFVKSKLSGARQVLAVLRNSYKLPIETPISNLRPARETCEQCHWPERFSGNIERVRTHYAADEENTPYRVVLSLKVGGGNPEHGEVQGIHWHVSSNTTVQYIASDEKRLIIPYVRVTHTDGTIEEFKGDGMEELGEIAADDPRLRTMDCIDCHNRPSHIYRSPAYAIDRAMDFGQVDPHLPNIKGIAVELMNGAYTSQAEAEDAISEGMRTALAAAVEGDPEKTKSLDNSIETVLNLYRTNIFPEHGVSFDKYPVHDSHFIFPGCYRCHDDKHVSESGKAVSNDCSLCHDIIGQAEGWETLGTMAMQKQPFVHPRGLEGAEEGTNCSECHSAST